MADQQRDQSKGHQEHITIFVNDHRYAAPASQMTGAELKRLDNVPTGNRLYLEGHGSHADTPIPDEQVIDLQSGMKFYDLPPGTVGLLATVEAQLERLHLDYPTAEMRPQPDGSIHVLLPEISTGSDWSPPTVRLLIILPPGYPENRPNGFEASPDLRLASGNQPSGSGAQAVAGEQWLHFCWQPASWDHTRENLWRYAKFCQQRFAEAR